MEDTLNHLPPFDLVCLWQLASVARACGTRSALCECPCVCFRLGSLQAGLQWRHFTGTRQEESGLGTEQRRKSTCDGPLKPGLSELSCMGLEWLSYLHLPRPEQAALGRARLWRREGLCSGGSPGRSQQRQAVCWLLFPQLGSRPFREGRFRWAVVLAEDFWAGKPILRVHVALSQWTGPM